jgi:drug/metabolite transporter (DMT)-like permease
MLLVGIASTAFVMNDALVKIVSAELPAGEIIVLRGVLATGMLSIAAVALGAVRPLRILVAPAMVLRLASSATATTLVVISLRQMPIATLNAILQFTPLAATIGAALVFGERIGLARAGAAVVALIGVLLIIKPGAGLAAATGCALTALAFSTLRDLSTRGLPADIPSIFVAAATAAAIVVAGLAIAPFEAWHLPSAAALARLGLAATMMFFANTFIIMGLRHGDFAATAPFRYLPIPLSLALGYWWWGDFPDATAACGIALVLGSGVYAFYRERARPTAPVGSIKRSSAARGARL